MRACRPRDSPIATTGFAVKAVVNTELTRTTDVFERRARGVRRDSASRCIHITKGSPRRNTEDTEDTAAMSAPRARSPRSSLRTLRSLMR